MLLTPRQVHLINSTIINRPIANTEMSPTTVKTRFLPWGMAQTKQALPEYRGGLFKQRL